jgi:hypothetical protein
MPRVCSICTHPLRATLDEALVRHTTSIRGLARTYGLGEDGLWWHLKHHLRLSMNASATMEQRVSVERLIERLTQIDIALDRVLARYEAAGDDAGVLRTTHEMRENAASLRSLALPVEQARQIDEAIARLEALDADDDPPPDDPWRAWRQGEGG